MFSSNNKLGIMDNVILNDQSMFNMSSIDSSKSVLPKDIDKGKYYTYSNSVASFSKPMRKIKNDSYYNPNIKIHDEEEVGADVSHQ